MGITRHICPAGPHQNIQIGTKMGLLYTVYINFLPSAKRQRGCNPQRVTPRHFSITNLEMQAPSGDIKFDDVAVLHQCQRAADCSFRRHVQHNRAIGRATHAPVGNPDHISDTLAQDFGRQRHVADFGKTGIAFGARSRNSLPSRWQGGIEKGLFGNCPIEAAALALRSGITLRNIHDPDSSGLSGKLWHGGKIRQHVLQLLAYLLS